MINKEKLSESEIFEQLVKDELTIMQKVYHPKIVRTLDTLQDK